MKISMLEALNISITGFVVVLIILALLACIILILSKVIRLFVKDGKPKKDTAEKSAEAPAPAPDAPTVQPSTGIELYKVSEKTAAAAMAIVSHESGIPLNKLAFRSVKLVEKETELYKTDDKTAAVIMAIVSDKSGIPLDRLVFKSIKLIEK